MTIPKIIHQTWKTSDVPERFRPLQDSWKRLHPAWEYRFYDDEACRALVAEAFPELLELYDACPHGVQRADIFRYLVVARHGGVYADMDVEAIRPLDPVLEGRGAVFGAEDHLSVEAARRLGYEHRERIANFIFAAEAGHPVFDLIRAELASLPGEWDMVVEVLKTTGPAMLTPLVLDHREELDLTVLPRMAWAAPDWRFWLPGQPHPDILARHHFAGTWKPAHGESVRAHVGGSAPLNGDRAAGGRPPWRPVHAARELARAVRLQAAPPPLADAGPGDDGPPAAPPRDDLVVTLSSIPSRMESLAPTLHSLLDQTVPPKEIVLALPDWSAREKRGYRVPREIAEHPRIRILASERDWGPATKLIPALLDYADRPGTMLVAVDDDNVYPRTFLETFVRWADVLPSGALTLRGCRVPPSRRWADCAEYKGSTIERPNRTDIVEGCAGILVRPAFFDEAFFAFEDAPEEAFYVDDVWVSGHLARRRVPAWVIPFEGAFVYVPVVASLQGPRLDHDENRCGHNNDVMLDYFGSYWGWA